MASRHEQEERYQRIIENIQRLPSLPEIATKLLDVVNSPHTSADDAASLIEKDPGLTTTVLRMANSAFYGMPRSVSSVSSAVVILGFNTIRSIVLSASLMKIFSGRDAIRGFDHVRFWRHSIMCALGAKLIARRCINTLTLDPESAFCAGILHDIGRLIFGQYVTAEFGSACRLAVEEKMPLVDAEKKVLGITHADIGAMLADKWALPLDLENALVYHHNPANADKSLPFVTAVHCADQMAHKAGANLWEKEESPPAWEGVYETLGFGDEDFYRVFEELEKGGDKPDEFLALINYG